MTNKRYSDNAGFKLPRRALTIIFGALPATVFCWYAVLAIVAGASAIAGGGVIFIVFGAAGLLGTYSLWSVAFGSESKFIVIGLVAGSIAMIPMLLVRSSVLPDIAGINKVTATTMIEASPVVVALIWLVYFFLKSGAREIEFGHIPNDRNRRY